MSKGKYKIKSLQEILIENQVELSCPVVIEGIPTNYSITSFGRLYSVFNNKIQFIKPTKDDGGYYKFDLHFIDDDGNQQRDSIMAERLVAMAFIPNPDPSVYTEVNHIKGNEKWNNNVTNLEWCDHSYNMQDAYDNNLHRKGEDNVLSVYTNDQIIRVCELLEENEKTLLDITNITGVAQYTILQIRNHKKWKHISKNYNVGTYNVKSVNTGSKPKYTDKQIEHVCLLLEKGELTLREIALLTEVGLNTVCDIKRHRTWRKIAKKYNF